MAAAAGVLVFVIALLLVYPLLLRTVLGLTAVSSIWRCGDFDFDQR